MFIADSIVRRHSTLDSAKPLFVTIVLVYNIIKIMSCMYRFLFLVKPNFMEIMGFKRDYITQI